MRECNSLEIIRGSPHIAFEMNDSSRVGAARRHAVILANEMGFDETLSGRVALIITELGTNLFKHAQKGRLLIATRAGPNPEIEILSIDAGPGILNLENAMRDGYSTMGSPGTGLGATQRLADDFDIFSDLSSGTIIVARIRRYNFPAAGKENFKVGVAGLCAPGETVSGDGWAVVLDKDKAAIIMADGLGHGPDAFAAADVAITQFLADPFENLPRALEKNHAALRITRGAAVSMAIIDTHLRTIRSAGAGNVITRLVSGTSNRSLLNQYGTVGVTMRRVEEISYSLPPASLVIMHTDGLLSRWKPEILVNVIIKDPSIAAAILLRDFCRGRDDVTVLVLQTRNYSV